MLKNLTKLKKIEKIILTQNTENQYFNKNKKYIFNSTRQK